MNFLAQQQAVADVLGLSLAISAQQTQIKRYLNQSQRMILQAHDWPFLRASNPYVLQTVADATNSTLSVTATTVAASTTVTFSGTIATSMAGRYLQTSSSKDWYRISAHTAGTNSMTLDTGVISAGSALTFTIRKFYYSLSATPTVDRVISMRQSVTPFQLLEMSKTVFEELKPDPNTTGTPKMFLMAGKDSTGIWQTTFWPIPDSIYNIFVEYVQEPADLSADSDTSLIPEKWRSTVMIEGAAAFGYQVMDNANATDAYTKFTNGIEMIKQEFSPSTSKIRVMRSVDNPLNQRPIPFPENYPLVR